MAKEWNDDEVQAEIAAAVQIVREDRFEKYVREKLTNPTEKKEDAGPPPPKDPTAAPPAPEKVKRGIFWGDAIND